MSVWQINHSDFPANGNTAEKIRFLLRYAILAPSSHNAQPWQCSIEAGKLSVFYDRRYALEFSDPIDRQAHISLGAFVANFALAAFAHGMKVDITWLPSREAVAEITVSSKEQKNPDQTVLQSIKDRRVNRGRFVAKKLPLSMNRAIASLGNDIVRIDIVERKTDIDTIAECVALGIAFAFKNEKFRRELAHYVVPNVSNRLDGIPGNTAQLGLFRSFAIPQLIRRFDIGKSQASNERRRFLNATAIAVLSSASDDQSAWLKVGYVFEQMALLLTQHGVSHSISAAPIEAPQLYQKVQKIAKIDYRPQMVVRLGFSHLQPPHSPRRPVSAILELRT